MSRPPVQPGVLPQPYALQFANSASFVDNVARTRDGRRVNGPAVPLPMTYYVTGELVTNNNSNTNSNAWKERRLMTSGVHSGSGLDFALGEDRELKELTNTATIAVAASSTASSMAMPTHAAYIPVRHMPTSPSASALQPGRPVGMTRELSYPTSHGNAALLGVYANNAGNGRGASEPYTAAGAVGVTASQAIGAPRRANWRSYAGPQGPRASLDTTMGAAMYGPQGSTLAQQQQQQLSSLQDADMPVSRHSRSRPAGLLSPQGSLQLIHHHNNTAQTHSASSHNNQGSGAAAGMTMTTVRGDDGSRLRVANTNTMLPLSACPSFGPPPPPRLPSLSLSLNTTNNNHIAPGSACEHHGLSSRRVNTESSTGRTSCCGPGGTQSGRLSPTRTSPRAPTMTARSQSSSRHSAAWLSTVPRHFTLLERQRTWQEVERYEQHLNYPKITLSAEALNNGDSEERRRRLEQRYKQVLYGKDTDGYRKYRLIVPTVGEREFHNPMHPVTPRPENDCSKRAFDKYLNAWRRQLHQWDNCDIANIGPEYKPLGTATLADLGLADRGSATVPALPVSAGGSLASAAVTGGPAPPQPLMLARPAAFKPLPGQRIMQSIANDALPATTTAGSAREGLVSALASQPPLLTNINNNTSSNNVSEVWATHGGEKSPSFFFHTSHMTPGAGVVNNNNNGAGHGMALNSARLLSSAAETPSRQDGPVLDFNFFANGTPSRQESPLNYMNSILYQALHNGHVSPTTHASVGGGGVTFEAGGNSGKTGRGCPTGTTTTTGSGDGPAVEETRTSCGDGCTSGPMVTLLRNEFDLISPFSARGSPAGPAQTASSLPTQDERVVGHGATVNALDAAPLGVAATLETWAQLPAIYYPAAGPHAAPRR